MSAVGGSVIVDGQHGGPIVLADGQRQSGPGVPSGVVGEIAQHPAQPGGIAGHPAGRLIIRTGRVEEGTALLDEAWARAREADVLAAMAPAAIALVERDWLTGDHHAETDAVPLLLTRTDRPGAHRHRGEFLRYLLRARSRGSDPTAPATRIEPFPDCPPEYAAGLRGDWYSAAAAWATIGDPYEQALELAESGQEQPTLQALSLLDDLGARPAAALVRAQLRRDGATRIPRGPRHRTRENPAGLTERQVDVLGLVAQGLTNAEIAGRLVLSTRTVDHHVAAILMKLDVSNRRDAGQRAAELGLG